MAELRRNQRGEIERQPVKAHSSSHFSPCFDHTSPTQLSQMVHDIGPYVPYSFRAMSRVLLGPLPTRVQGLRRQGQGLKVTAQWRDHVNLERGFTWYMLVLACLYSWPWLRTWTFTFKFLFLVLVIGTTQGETEEDAQIDSMDVVDSLRMRSCLKMAVLTLMMPKHSPTTAPEVQTFCGLPPTNLVTCSVWIIRVTEMPLCSRTTQIFIILI